VSNSSNEFSIVNDKNNYCANFKNNFEVDDNFNDKSDISSGNKNKIQKDKEH